LNTDKEKMMSDEHARRDEEFRRLLVDPSATQAEVGDRVVVAAGLLGRGWQWIREEAEVIAVGETSYKVRFVETPEDDGEPTEQWIHPAIVIDVLGPAKGNGKDCCDES
jgi:hypothetical protein